MSIEIPTSDGQTWRISPFVRPLPRIVDRTGACAYPDDVEHCHGTEVQHGDDVAECFQLGEPCAAPRPGKHVYVHSCAEIDELPLWHRCSRCRD
ncbi:hypothetical protein [Pseudonocardia sp. Ae707_Ps1]|uniref:hypothetical protein n=1 Tax=Pseudonocardia sp. Ae707_Ps1 TaxID=1885572 RepID=UPI0001FFDB96|nr:hypothetical protein [Pseudonocardia sp. Ae707_Ps1]